MNFLVAILSKGRGKTITSHRLFPSGIILVPLADVESYIWTGWVVIAQKSKGVAAARNEILDRYTDRNVLMLDDDVSEIGLFRNDRNKQPLSGDALIQKVDALFAYAKARRACYFGCAPTTNAFYYSPKDKIGTNLFVNGSFSGYLAGCPIRCDEALLLKEDYDFTVRAWLKCGIVLRFNDVYAEAQHRTNAGGACAYRTHEIEVEAINRLRARWGKYIILNPRRPDEILLRLPARKMR